MGYSVLTEANQLTFHPNHPCMERPPNANQYAQTFFTTETGSADAIRKEARVIDAIEIPKVVTPELVGFLEQLTWVSHNVVQFDGAIQLVIIKFKNGEIGAYSPVTYSTESLDAKQSATQAALKTWTQYLSKKQ